MHVYTARLDGRVHVFHFSQNGLILIPAAVASGQTGYFMRDPRAIATIFLRFLCKQSRWLSYGNWLFRNVSPDYCLCECAEMWKLRGFREERKLSKCCSFRRVLRAIVNSLHFAVDYWIETAKSKYSCFVKLILEKILFSIILNRGISLFLNLLQFLRNFLIYLFELNKVVKSSISWIFIAYSMIIVGLSRSNLRVNYG